MSHNDGKEITSDHPKHPIINDYEDSRSSISSDDTQIGVKNIEAISQTWTKSSLIAAYLG